MPPDADIPRDRPTLLLESILGNRKTLRTILSRSEERETILDKASVSIIALDATEATTFTKTILRGLATEDTQWNQDRRDGALEILPLVDLGKIRQEELTQSYIEAVASQNGDSDPYGTISGLGEAGKIVGPFLPPGAQTRERVNGAWAFVAGLFEGEAKTFIDGIKAEVIATIPLNAEELIGNPEIRLGWREKPKFDPGEEVLHDAYVGATQGRRTFKLTLWDNVPNFRTLTSTHGLDLERFWNLNNPDEVHASFGKLNKEGSPLAMAHLNRSLMGQFDLGIEGLTGDYPRVVADEIIHAARAGQMEILGNMSDFSARITRFKEIIEETEGKPTQAQRVLFRQVANFFSINGVTLTPGTFGNLRRQLDDPAILKQAEAAFNQKYNDRRQASQELEEIFCLTSRQSEFSLMSRQRDDLMLGDLTGDCTAYHLVVGMNAWTLPGWVTNPGFNFFKIASGDRLVSKMGMVLALADGVLVLDGDSFEVGTGVKNEVAAVDKIKEGLGFLGKWSREIGLGDPFINTISNSSGATELLRGLVKRSWVEGMTVLGGLTGVAELRKNLTGQEGVIERMYLQSEERELQNLEDDDEILEQGRYIQAFEEIISNTIDNASAGGRVKVETAARGQDWPELFKSIIEVNYPEVAKVFGSDWTVYQKYMENLVLNELGQAHTVRYSRYGDSDHGILTQTIAERLRSEEAISWTAKASEVVNVDDVEMVYVEDSHIYAQTVDVDQLLVLFKEMEFRRLTPEIALKQLYSQVSNEDLAANIDINKRLPRLTI